MLYFINQVKNKALKQMIIESLEKRFSMPRDGVWLNRITLFEECIDEIKKNHPEVLSAMVYGSLVNPYKEEKEASDIDAWVFVDVDQNLYSLIII